MKPTLAALAVMALAGHAQAAPTAQSMKATMPEVAPLVVTPRKTVEQMIREKGWVIAQEGDWLGKLPDGQVVCRQLLELNTRIRDVRYTCGKAGDWRQITADSRRWTECVQHGVNC